MTTNFPPIPSELFEPDPVFIPDMAMTDWIFDTFITGDTDLANPEHHHLQNAYIGFLWTNTEASNKGKIILGQAEKPSPTGTRWSGQRTEYWLTEWFGELPDFIITINSQYWQQASSAQRCALTEHELYHCAQAEDQYGAPRFNQTTGKPSWTIAPHDVEQFTGVIERYGATSAEEARMAEAFDKKPKFEAEMIDGICGTCKKKVA